jgi:hypothetical protein
VTSLQGNNITGVVVMTEQGEASLNRVYSASEIDACLHFVRLPSVSSPSSTTDTANAAEWWPCLVFQNMVELHIITQQLNLWSTLPKGQIMMTYMNHLPASATCRVALLMGQPPSNNPILQFDATTTEALGSCPKESSTQSLSIKPFYDNVLQYGVLYCQNEQYLRAIQQTLPLLHDVAESLRRNTDNISVTTDTATDEIPPPKIEDNTLPESSDRDTRNLDVTDPRTGSSPGLSTTLRSSATEGKTKSPKPASSIATAPSKAKSVSLEFVEIPTFKDVKTILTKGGYTIDRNNGCRRPPYMFEDDADDSTHSSTMPAESFTTIAKLRHDLCVHGVNCRCGTAMEEDKACKCWSEDEKWLVKLWVRYNVIRGPIKESSPVSVISPHLAKQYLIRLGYCRRQLESPLLTEEQIRDLFRYLSRYGLPSQQSEGSNDLSCNYTQLTPEERFSLEYFLSTNYCRVNTL